MAWTFQWGIIPRPTWQPYLQTSKETIFILINTDNDTVFSLQNWVSQAGISCQKDTKLMATDFTGPFLTVSFFRTQKRTILLSNFSWKLNMHMA